MGVLPWRVLHDLPERLRATVGPPGPAPSVFQASAPTLTSDRPAHPGAAAERWRADAQGGDSGRDPESRQRRSLPATIARATSPEREEDAR